MALAQVAERLLQGKLFEALRCHFAGEAGDGGGLVGVALLGGLQAICGEIGAGVCRVDPLSLDVQGHQQGNDQPRYAKPSFPAGHAACSWACSAANWA